jgi:hypothetical protein
MGTNPRFSAKIPLDGGRFIPLEINQGTVIPCWVCQERVWVCIPVLVYLPASPFAVTHRLIVHMFILALSKPCQKAIYKTQHNSKG